MQIFTSLVGVTQSISRTLKKWWCILEAEIRGNRTAIPLRLLQSIQEASLSYRYRGRVLEKNPFDLALYSMLISSLRPGTIIEIGSRFGGSAEWFADQALLNGLETKVFSFDLEQSNQSARKNLVFGSADIHRLEVSSLPQILRDAKRPLLISEDGPHTLSGSLAALRFFDQYLIPGDYIVIEDGNLANLGYWGFGGGPTKAIEAFLAEEQGKYRVDRDYCDFYGKNVTWNINGWIARI